MFFISFLTSTMNDSTSSFFHPSTLVKRAIPNPSKAGAKFSFVHRPILVNLPRVLYSVRVVDVPNCLYFGSFGQWFIGHLYLVSTTFTKPASSSSFLKLVAPARERPTLVVPSRLIADHWYSGELGSREPSSDKMGKHLSASST